MLLEIAIGFLIFVVGYTLGRINFVYSRLAQGSVEASGLFLKNKSKTKKRAAVKIDERKFVTEVETNSFSKNFETLGKETVSNSNVSDAVSKLKKLKHGE